MLRTEGQQSYDENKNTYKLTAKKFKQLIKKWARNFNRNFSKDIQMATQAHENMLTIIREMQIKTRKYHLTLIRILAVERAKK